MSRALKNKLIAVFMTIFLSCTVLSVGMMVSRANTPITLSDINLTLSEAEVMIDGEDGKDGLKFNANLSASDYEQLIAIVGENKTYVSMETGVVIAPNYYNVETPIERYSLFGAGATYDYATWNGSNYVYNGDKIRVININANDWVKDGENYVYSGAIVDILPANVSEEFFAIAYIKVVDALGGEEYKFSSSSVTSMAYATQVAIEDGVLTGSKASYAQAHFVDVVNEKFTFTTEYYVKTENGYELKESVISSDAYALDAEVEAIIKDYSSENLELDEEASSVLTGKVKANDKLTLKVYYREALAEVIGFNTLSNVVVTKGAKVLIEQPEPVNQYGEILTVYTDVVDVNGGHVTLYKAEEGKYFYANGTEYTISYVVYPYDGAITLKTTTVTVVGSATVNVEYDKIVETGKEISINATSGFYAPNFTYSVIKDADSSSVTVTDGKFTLNEVGFYTVTVKADSLGKEAETSYQIYARQPMKKGEVETIYNDWEDLRKANGYDTHGWKVTDTKTTGIKNFFGLDDTFATIKVNSTDLNVMFWLDPLYDIDTYRAMIDEGYTNVTFYVYSDAKTSHTTELITDPMVGSFLNEASTPLAANGWTKVSVNLFDVVQDERHDGCIARSFLSGFNVYDDERFGFFNVDNASGEEFNLYFTSVYVTKTIEITAADATTTFKVGDTVDLSTLVTPIDGVDFDYFIVNETGKTEVQKADKNYTFKANGTYSVMVVPEGNDLLGELKVELTVTDSITAANGWKKIEMTGDSVTVNFSDLGASFKDGDTVLTATPFAVFFGDNELEKTDTGFTATTPGNYKVYYKANYGDGLTTYSVFDVDVYTASAQYTFAKAEDFIATRYWSYSKLPTYHYGEYTVNDVTATMFYVPAATGNHVVLFKPLYSVSYYQDVIANNDTCQVVLTFHVQASGENLFVKAHVPNLGDDNYATGSYTQLIDLEHFVTEYDKYVNAYARELKVVNNGGTPAYNYNYSAKDCLYAANNSSKDYIGILDMVIARSYVDETEYLIDVDTLNASTYDATSIINDEAKEVVSAYGSSVTYKLTDKFGNTIDGSVIDVTKTFNKRLWKLEAIANGQSVYTGYVDIYSTSDGFVWNDDPNWVRYSGTKLSTPVSGVETTLTKDTEEIKVTKFSYTAAVTYSHFTVIPQHSKTYYEQYRGKVTLKFNIYIERLKADGTPDTSTKFAQNVRWANTNSAYMSQYATSTAMNNAWYTVERSINRYLDKWTFVEFEGASNSFNAMVNYGMVLAYQVQKPAGASSISLSDITFTQA